MEALALRQQMMRWWAEPAGMARAQSLAEIARQRNPLAYVPGAFNKQDLSTLGATLSARLEHSVSYYVSSDMAALVSGASSSRPWDVPLHMEDVPVQRGFALLAVPTYMHTQDDDGTLRQVGVRAFSWATSLGVSGAPGVEVVFYGAASDRRDSLMADLREQRVDPFVESGPLLVVHAGFVPYGQPFEDARWWQMWPAAFWHLVQQPLASLVEQEPDRAARKRFERAKVPAGRVTVVTLRRATGKRRDGTESSYTLTHQFLVSGHWRKQPYPSRNDVKVIWIAPFVKGPEDAPLIVREHVYAWRR